MNFKYVEALDEFDGSQPSIFLAGGITGCPDWQVEMARMLQPLGWAILNPRRANFPIHDPSAAQQQIEWEFRHLRKATQILFWFCKETIQPIVLYELGAWAASVKPIFVGCHPEYPRRQDVLIQTRLARPGLEVVSSLRDLADQIL